MFFTQKNVSRATNHNQITYLANKIKACTWYIAKIGYQYWQRNYLYNKMEFVETNYKI